MKEKESEDPIDPSQKVMDWTGKTYRSFTDRTHVSKEDSLIVMGLKILAQFMGIIFMILISPFVILGLIVAFLAVF